MYLKNFFLITLTIAVFTSGCGTWTKSDPIAHSFDEIWEASYATLRKRYEIIRADKKEGSIESDWNYNMSVFYLESFRRKVLLEIEEAKEISSDEEEFKKFSESLGEEEQKIEINRTKHIIKIQVKLEQNRNIDNPASKSEGYWYPIENDKEEEFKLIAFIISYLKAYKK